MKKKYNSKEKAINFIASFRNEKFIEHKRCEYSFLKNKEAAKVAEIALRRNVNNLKKIVNHFETKMFFDFDPSEYFEVLLKDEIEILKEVINIQKL